MTCPECGVEVTERSVYCHKCGCRLDLQNPGDPDPNPTEVAAEEQSATDQTYPPPDSPIERFRQGLQSTREGNQAGEEELWEGGYCSKAMMGSWLIVGAISVALLVLAIVIWSNAYVWYGVLAAIVIAWAYVLIVYARRRLGVHYRLTTQRFFHETGILVHTTDLIEVIDMDDITYSQTIIDRMFGVGTIRVVSSDRSHPDLSVPGIANVKDVAAKMHKARHEERLRRGLHIEAI